MERSGSESRPSLERVYVAGKMLVLHYCVTIDLHAF